MHSFLTNKCNADSYTYYYETDDCIEDYITSFVQTNWINALKNILDAVDWDYSWYHIDDVYWDIIPRDFTDVEEWIDDILSELWYDEADSNESILADKDLKDETTD